MRMHSKIIRASKLFRSSGLETIRRIYLYYNMQIIHEIKNIPGNIKMIA